MGLQGFWIRLIRVILGVIFGGLYIEDSTCDWYFRFGVKGCFQDSGSFVWP